jgi:pimeloyl-ACP methyl ester carboxylesterase
MNDLHFEFEIDGKRIPAALTEPVGNKPEWCVVLVPGSGPSDIDGNFAEGGMWPGRTNVLRDLAHQIAEAGAACVRYSRSNMTTTDEIKARAFKRFDHRAKVVAQLCSVARERSGARYIAIAGHSEGSVVGSMVCVLHPEAQVDAYISLSGPAYRFYDLMLHGANRRAVNGVLQLGPMKMSLDLYRKAIEVARDGTPAPEELNSLPFGFHKMDPDSQDYLRGYDGVDNREMVAKIRQPVLIVQGGADESGVWFENGVMLVECRRNSGHPTEQAFFSDLDHFYKRAGNESVDPRVAAAVVNWLRTCLS